jgi:hypothetical protein
MWVWTSWHLVGEPLRDSSLQEGAPGKQSPQQLRQGTKARLITHITSRALKKEKKWFSGR